MAKDAETIIAKRDAVAKRHMSGQSMAVHTAGGIGEWFADGYDRAKAALRLDSNESVFLRAGALGATRGAFYGLLAGAACLAFTGIALFPLLIAGGAIWFGVRDSQRRLNYHLYSGHKNLSDDVARLSGAVPSRHHGHSAAPSPNVHAEMPDLNPGATGGHVAHVEASREVTPSGIEL